MLIYVVVALLALLLLLMLAVLAVVCRKPAAPTVVQASPAAGDRLSSAYVSRRLRDLVDANNRDAQEKNFDKLLERYVLDRITKAASTPEGKQKLLDYIEAKSANTAQPATPPAAAAAPAQAPTQHTAVV